MNTVVNCADCWSPLERKMKSVLEKIKLTIFFPFIKILIKLHVTANMISYFSAFIGLAATIEMFFDVKISAILLVLSLIIDGIDGSVARETKTNNLQGSVTDSFADQITISATTIGFIATSIVNPIIGCLYLVSYPSVIIFTILRNIINQPSPYVFRPRIIVYGAFVLYAFFSINIMNIILLPLAIILLIQLIKDCYFLRGTL